MEKIHLTVRHSIITCSKCLGEGKVAKGQTGQTGNGHDFNRENTISFGYKKEYTNSIEKCEDCKGSGRLRLKCTEEYFTWSERDNEEMFVNIKSE